MWVVVLVVVLVHIYVSILKTEMAGNKLWRQFLSQYCLTTSS